tara:strand:+ start:328 stop:759 length:432 start_codon:yes stop_codon:yes gene_type:complete
MKKIIIFKFLLLSFCFSQELAKTNDGKLVILYENGRWEYVNSSNSNVIDNNKSVKIFITRTGKKYHRDGCRYLKSRIPSTINDAISKGLTPCSVCKPPTISNKLFESKSNNNYQSDGRCMAITQKGSRCKRSVQSGSLYCWQH